MLAMTTFNCSLSDLSIIYNKFKNYYASCRAIIMYFTKCRKNELLKINSKYRIMLYLKFLKTNSYINYKISLKVFTNRNQMMHFRNS